MTATAAPRSQSRRVGTAHRPLAAVVEDGGQCPPYGTTSSTTQPTASARHGRERVRIPSPRSTHHAPLELVPIPQATLVRALERIDATLADPNASHRDTNAAARTLLAFLKYNQDTLRALIDAQEHEATPPPSEDGDDSPELASASEAPGPAGPTDLDAEEAPQASAETAAVPPASSPGAAPEPAKIPPCPYVNLAIPPEGQRAVMIVAEDPTPEAPAFERYGGLVLFRVGARTNLNGDIRPLYYCLPPGPDRELLKDPSVPLHRRGGGFARLQRFAELGLPPYVAPAAAHAVGRK